VVYGRNPLRPLGLSPLHPKENMSMEASKRVKGIQELHKKIQGQIEKASEHYQSSS